MKIMVKKSRNQLIRKEAEFQNRKRINLPDEITLKDEILELKRQLMILKRTNEQYLVKLRKYEDEAKRKDKQLEQLMDPRKNSDIAKILSRKGAAILMNLKDQNNALIQMILNKDLHIRKLIAEKKMSKLYSSTKKNESYRAEISRLRNLLMKSQEMLKESADAQEQSRSICVSGNAFLEVSTSSDESSPRDLDELRLTILSLESHIQQSNELLARKNQEIFFLREEVDFLNKLSSNKTFKNKSDNCVPNETKARDFSMPDSPSLRSDVFVPIKILSRDITDLFYKNSNQEDKKLLNSEQNASKNWVSSVDSILKYHTNQSYGLNETTALTETGQENIEIANKHRSVTEKSHFHNLVTDEIKKEEKIISSVKKTAHTKEKWKKVLNKYRELKKLNLTISAGCVKDEEVGNKNENKYYEFLDEEKKLQESDKIIQNGEILEIKDFKNMEVIFHSPELSELFMKEKTESTPRTSGSSNTGTKDESEIYQSNVKESWIFKDEKDYDTEETVLSDETHYRKEAQQTNPQSPGDYQKELPTATQKPGSSDNVDSKSTKHIEEIYFRSLDSSSDSEYGYSEKQNFQQVQVEVQINSVSSQSDNDQPGNHIFETNQFYDYVEENKGNRTPELDFNDDDDVIIREK